MQASSTPAPESQPDTTVDPPVRIFRTISISDGRLSPEKEVNMHANVARVALASIPTAAQNAPKNTLSCHYYPTKSSGRDLCDPGAVCINGISIRVLLGIVRVLFSCSYPPPEVHGGSCVSASGSRVLQPLLPRRVTSALTCIYAPSIYVRAQTLQFYLACRKLLDFDRFGHKVTAGDGSVTDCIHERWSKGHSGRRGGENRG